MSALRRRLGGLAACAALAAPGASQEMAGQDLVVRAGTIHTMAGEARASPSSRPPSSLRA
jgi:hypothetical protein